MIHILHKNKTPNVNVCYLCGSYDLCILHFIVIYRLKILLFFNILHKYSLTNYIKVLEIKL